MEPSSDHAYVHGPFGHPDLDPSKLTVCPATGVVGLYVKLAVGGAGGGGGGGEVGGTAVTGAVGAELAEAEPPSLLAVTTTRIM